MVPVLALLAFSFFSVWDTSPWESAATFRCTFLALFNLSRKFPVDMRRGMCP